MELVPEEELETSTQRGSNSLNDRRALKVVFKFFNYNKGSIKFNIVA